MKHRITFIILALASTSCDAVNTVAPLLKDAIVDLDVEGLAKDKACGLYTERGRELAEAAFEHEWPQFAPMFETPPDVEADRAFCEGLITGAGARIVTKQSDQGSASAVCMVAEFPKDFESRSPEERAAITCHEAAHILEQGRVGCVDWLQRYFVTISARMTFEGTAYALQMAILERHGWSPVRTGKHLDRIGTRFPDRYLIPREVISDECTPIYFGAIREALRERTSR